MPRMFHAGGLRTGARQRVFIATPTYGQLPALFVDSLWTSYTALQAAGVDADVAILSGNCHVDDSRNNLIRDFLESDCTDLMFIDADIGWDPAELIQLLRYDRDVIGGIYPKKMEEEEYPVRFLDRPHLIGEEDGALEVAGIPGGFTRIRRHVLETLAEQSDKYFGGRDDPDKRLPIPIIYERTLHETRGRVSGDYAFCDKAIAAGFQIHVDPTLHFEHIGSYSWEGCLGDWLRRVNGLDRADMGKAIEAIRQDKPSPQTFATLHKGWDNPAWSASPEFLATCFELARQAEGPILETGSGLSSLVLAASTRHEVHALEHDPIWATAVRDAAEEHGLDNLVVHYCPLRGGWYDVNALDRMPARFDLVVCDGPPRNRGDRAILFDYSAWFPCATVLMDDVGDPAQSRGLKSWSEVWGREVKILNETGKAFALSYYPVERVSAA